MPKAGIEQMQGGMFHTSVVPVHGEPVFHSFPGGDGVFVVGIHVADEVPGGARPLGHGVRLPLGGGAALGTGHVHPVGHLRQGAFPGLGGLIGIHVRQNQGQVLFLQRHRAAVGTVDDGDGLAPVTLTGEDPVSELEVDLFIAHALFREEGDDLLFGFGDRKPVEEVGVDHFALGAVHVGFLGDIPALHHLDDGQIEDLGEFIVPFVVGGHRHDGAGAVGRQNVVGNENGDLPAVHGIGGSDAQELDAGLGLGDLGSFKIALPGGFRLVGADLVQIGELICPFFDEGVLRRHNHIGGAEEGVGTGGIDLQIVPRAGFEGDLSAGGTADPVPLLGLDPLDEVHAVQSLKELLGVFGDLQHPLALHPTDHLTAAALAHAAGGFLVGKHALAGRTPVHRHFLLIGEALLIELQKDPLGPLVVVGIGGIHLPRPVEGKAQGFQLLLEMRHILLRDNPGMNVILDGVILRGQTEGVPAHGVEDVDPFQAFLPRHDVQGGIGAGMPHVQTLSGGIGKFHQSVELGQGIVVFGDEGAFCVPLILPLFFDLFELVLHFSTFFALVFLGGEGDLLRLRPKLFQFIKLPAGGVEHVDDHVAVINEDPGAAVISLHPGGGDAVLFLELIFHLIAEGFHLGVASAAADDEIVGNDGLIRHVEDLDILSFLFVQDAGDPFRFFK